jgi:iron complex outermembrane receptor protein
MINISYTRSALAGVLLTVVLCTSAVATNFNIPAGKLETALDAYTTQTGVALVVSDDIIKNLHTGGAKGDLSPDEALARILNGTGLITHHHSAGSVAIVRDDRADAGQMQIHEAAATAPSVSAAALETVTVTSSKIGGDVQNIPISITALSQEQLTATQTTGGPDLVKQVPNLTFTKTNFTGYNIQIRGIGTQAISVTTDPAVAVAFNDIPFLRNHFFEQEFYDVSQLEVLRGPQGTLYGRNATAGVVNLVSAKPTDQFEALASADIGNYENRRFEAMINLPIVDDKLDLRVAGEWTKRQGYTFNEETDQRVDGRDLWSGRVTLGWKPIEKLQTYLIWEHFSEDDDRVRSSKQLCKKDSGPSSIDGFQINPTTLPISDDYLPEVSREYPADINSQFVKAWLSQGCLPASLYSKESYETPNGQVIPFVALGEFLARFGGADGGFILRDIDPYASQTQSTNLRVIQSLINPAYRAKNDTLEFNTDYAVAPDLTLTSQTGYNKDFLYSTEDFNRFDTQPGLFYPTTVSAGIGATPIAPNGVYCDPQLGCSSAMVGQDLSQEHAWQFSQEMRLTSHFEGPFNFSVGGNYLHYQTVEDYYVFFNLITAAEQIENGQSGTTPGQPGDYTLCHSSFDVEPPFIISPESYTVPATGLGDSFTGRTAVSSIFGCANALSFADKLPATYIDPNPLTQIDGQGHNYFRSENPYRLNSVAGFGEAYYQVLPDVKLTAGLRWTDDSKTFFNIPSWVFELGGGYPVESIVRQEWKEWTGRFIANWTPKLDFTDATLVYGSYSRGYKGGGANPPGPVEDLLSAQSSLTHPPTFAPEFINAYEIGTKNTLLDGGLTLNGDVFYYDYKGYQISQIVDRTSINLNFDAKVKGAELEATWEPIAGLRFNFAGGLEDSSVNKGQSAIDLMDRTDGHTDWVVVKPFPSETSNCILPASVVLALIQAFPAPDPLERGLSGGCDAAYSPGGFIGEGQGNTLDQATFASVGFNPATAPNNGEGFTKDLSGNKLPNTPPFTLSFGAQYTMPLTPDWAGTLRGDFYWQGNSFARIFNDEPYDQLHAYTNVNLSLTFTNQDGWQAMAYIKNVFDTTAITGAFLNSDDTALTTNVFVTDPRLFGVRLTKNW